ncbi:MAG: fibrobacter succinogenes major paralogous domain-containing protein, partial [Deltaproteobacteria bacterium]|nr:fibrobacter succinogenes major paralogous domain-containing protein [Deltaproteobacteria bacterium]
NLNTTSFTDGEPIPEYAVEDDWFNGNELLPRFQWSNTDDLNDIHPEPLPVDFYGALYNEVVLASGRLAPPGWRIPTTEDFRDLEAFVATDGHAGSESEALKAVFSWSPDEANGTDVYGFAALPNGYVSGVGTATGTPIIGTLATSDMNPEGDARRTVVNLMDQGALQYAENSIFLGAGVRCIRE